mmetsp:Transcript_88361/g.210971  ORF Transcript_88361/g.210971 Transcript_88361/m.210971 type:complete len:228 (-) Transcript_88361:244-927(-)
MRGCGTAAGSRRRRSLCKRQLQTQREAGAEAGGGAGAEAGAGGTTRSAAAGMMRLMMEDATGTTRIGTRKTPLAAVERARWLSASESATSRGMPAGPPAMMTGRSRPRMRMLWKRRRQAETPVRSSARTPPGTGPASGRASGALRWPRCCPAAWMRLCPSQMRRFESWGCCCGRTLYRGCREPTPTGTWAFSEQTIRMRRPSAGMARRCPHGAWSRAGFPRSGPLCQ